VIEQSKGRSDVAANEDYNLGKWTILIVCWGLVLVGGYTLLERWETRKFISQIGANHHN